MEDLPDSIFGAFMSLFAYFSFPVDRLKTLQTSKFTSDYQEIPK